MSYIMLRGRWCDISVLNVHASGDDRNSDNYSEEVGCLAATQEILGYCSAVIIALF
jgi:hypothetical protein